MEPQISVDIFSPEYVKPHYINALAAIVLYRVSHNALTMVFTCPQVAHNAQRVSGC